MVDVTNSDGLLIERLRADLAASQAECERLRAECKQLLITIATTSLNRYMDTCTANALQTKPKGNE